MRGFFSAIREGYKEQRVRSGPSRPFFEWTARPASAPGATEQATDTSEAPVEPDIGPGRDFAREAELEGELRQCAQELAELAEYAEQMRDRIAELESLPPESETFAAVLRLRGVEKWLRAKFHPDKHPDADEEARQAYTEATQHINAAYSALKRQDRQPTDDD